MGDYVENAAQVIAPLMTVGEKIGINKVRNGQMRPINEGFPSLEAMQSTLQVFHPGKCRIDCQWMAPLYSPMRRESAARRKSSRSPSSTASALPFSTPVRTSFTMR